MDTTGRIGQGNLDAVSELRNRLVKNRIKVVKEFNCFEILCPAVHIDGMLDIGLAVIQI